MSDTDERAAGASVTVRVRFRGAELDRVVEVEVPSGPRKLTDLLPMTRALSDELTAAAIESEEAAGRKISCRAGCGACCRQLVVISVVEAQGLAELVAKLPPERQATIRARFAAAVRRLEEAGLLDGAAPPGGRNLIARNAGSLEASVQDLARRYFARQIACPFLENESCSIYAERPSVCREYHVTSPAERCASLFDESVERVPIAQRMGDSLMRAAHATAGVPLGKIPFALALEWAEANGERLAATHDGVDLFKALMSES